MKRKITLLVAAAFGTFALQAQTLSESFTSPFNPTTAGWSIQNNSVPQGTVSWFQGNGANFAANSGGVNDYYAVDFRSQAATAGGISNFLITPTVSLTNGAIIRFATRTATATTTYPDRLQLRMSTAGTSTGAIGTGTTAVGSFTTLLLDINPLYSVGTTSTVSNGTVNGYPQSWTTYAVVLSGITGTVTGRFAFRYTVDDGGLNGANSDYIGIDDVDYSLPCGATVASYTTCPSVSTTLTANNSFGTTSYTWQPGGATTSSIVVNPASTTVYTLTTVNNSVTCPAKTATVTVGSSLSVSVSASSTTICAGNTTTISAFSSATTYSWSNGATSQVIAVTPSVTTTYSVGASSGLCFGGNAIVINVNAAPNVSMTASAGPTICTSSTAQLTLTASGGVSYVWSSPNSTVTTNVVALATPTTAGNYVLSVTGAGSNGCTKTFTAPLVMANCTGLTTNAIENTNAGVYPNPFTNEITISGVTGTVQIFNTLGQVVLTTTITNSEKINTTSLAKGIYFVKVKNTDTNTTQTIKVIKD